LYARITFTTTDGEIAFGDIFAKPDKNGGHDRLDQFVAATSIDSEIKELLSGGEVEVNEDFLAKVTQRSVGRHLKLVVTERKYTKRDGTEGVAYQGSFFRRLPNGPNPF
jgi:hypothetical protein